MHIRLDGRRYLAKRQSDIRVRGAERDYCSSSRFEKSPVCYDPFKTNLFTPPSRRSPLQGFEHTQECIRSDIGLDIACGGQLLKLIVF